MPLPLNIMTYYHSTLAFYNAGTEGRELSNNHLAHTIRAFFCLPSKQLNLLIFLCALWAGLCAINGNIKPEQYL